MNDLKMKIIQEMFSHEEQPDSYIADQILALIQQEIKECLPEERDNMGLTDENVTGARIKGFNACRQNIIANLKAKGLTN